MKRNFAEQLEAAADNIRNAGPSVQEAASRLQKAIFALGCHFELGTMAVKKAKKALFVVDHDRWCCHTRGVHGRSTNRGKGRRTQQYKGRKK